MGTEQRRHERRSLKVEFRGKDAHGAGQLVLLGADLSAGGAFLASDVLLEEGEPLHLAFSLPGSERLLKAQGRVAWVRRFPRGEETAGMGVEFLAMGQEDRQALMSYLSTLADDF